MFDGFTLSFAPFTEEAVVHASLMSKLCVSMFAFVSGYGLFLSFRNQVKMSDGISRYVVSRYLKTMLPFFFLYAVSFVVTLLIDGYPLRIYFEHGITTGVFYVMLDFLGLAGIIGTPMMLGSWWYMSAAIVMIICLPMLYELGKKIGWFPLTMLSILIPYAIGMDCPGTTNVLTFLPVFIIGMSLADSSVKNRVKPASKNAKTNIQLTLFIIGTVLVFVYLFRLTMNIDFYDVWYLTLIVLPLLLLFVLKEIINKIPVVSTLLAFLGRHSMSMFILHGFIRGVYLHDFIYSCGNFILCFAILTAISLLVAIIADGMMKLTGYTDFTNSIASSVVRK